MICSGVRCACGHVGDSSPWLCWDPPWDGSPHLKQRDSSPHSHAISTGLSGASANLGHRAPTWSTAPHFQQHNTSECLATASTSPIVDPMRLMGSELVSMSSTDAVAFVGISPDSYVPERGSLKDVSRRPGPVASRNACQSMKYLGGLLFWCSMFS